MNVQHTVDNLAKAGSRDLSQIIVKTRMNFDLGHNSFSKLFQSCVVPVLDYGIAVWNTGKSSKYGKADQVQERAIRYYCGLPRMTPILGMEGEMGWLPGMVRRDMECLRLYNQLIKMPDSSIAKTVMMRDKAIKGCDSWYSNIEAICNAAGMEEELASD